jgi:hypothetical protein
MFLSAPASAASCKVMTVAYALTSGDVIALDPDHYDVAYGGCVQFTNQTATTATVTVGAHYSHDIGPNESTAGATNYAATTSGRQQVTAKSGPSTASGSITVGAAPAPSRSPTSRPTASPSTHSSSPQPSSSGTGPQVAPTPSPPKVGGFVPKHHPPTPPSGAPTAGPTKAVPAPVPSSTAVATGPVEPTDGRRMGLPAALAAMAVAGVGAALIRVVVAEPLDPVDSGKTVGRPA